MSDKKEAKEKSPPNNIIFVGEKGKEQLGYMNGRVKVTLPKEGQDKGFYHERASEIVRIFGSELYKLIKTKDGKPV